MICSGIDRAVSKYKIYKKVLSYCMKISGKVQVFLYFVVFIHIQIERKQFYEVGYYAVETKTPTNF